MAPPSLPDDVISEKTVCVMDASGEVGSALVRRLLRRGYTVHAALHGEYEIIEGLRCNNKKVRVFQADPLDYHSITNALKGCSALFYCFQPPSDHPTYDEYMADVEVRAAHNVLEACAQTETIEKAIFTSSVTAVIWKDDRNTTPSDLDERNWSDVNFCRKFKLWHGVSKTLAERTAWALAMDRGVNMVSINGGLLMNPESLTTISNPYLKGAAEMFENGVLVTVDLNFLVDSHISVFEHSSSYGRYLCFDNVFTSNQDAIRLANMLLPSPTPTRSLDDDTSVYQQRISNKKLNKLMVDFKSEVEV